MGARRPAGAARAAEGVDARGGSRWWNPPGVSCLGEKRRRPGDQPGGELGRRDQEVRGESHDQAEGAAPPATTRPRSPMERRKPRRGRASGAFLASIFRMLSGSCSERGVSQLLLSGRNIAAPERVTRHSRSGWIGFRTLPLRCRPTSRCSGGGPSKPPLPSRSTRRAHACWKPGFWSRSNRRPHVSRRQRMKHRGDWIATLSGLNASSGARAVARPARVGLPAAARSGRCRRRTRGRC